MNKGAKVGKKWEMWRIKKTMLQNLASRVKNYS